MLQIIQNWRSGELTLADVPPPTLRPGGIVVRTACSLISTGTEKMVIDLARKSLVGKARARPDLVRRVADMARRDGLLATIETVRSKLEQTVPLGYSASGVVEAVAEGITDFKPGDRVAMAGAGYATHAEVNYVPRNLAVSMPPEVGFEEAAFTTVASIALQGVRLAKPEVGDLVAVIGLGLVGLLAVQILQANGCRVVGFDPDPERVNLGLELGMEAGGSPEPGPAADLTDGVTAGRGVDHTLVTAATSSNDPISLAGEITRRKGNVVVVGAVGMDIPRETFYQKELHLQVSMSYGPGRYDPTYEEGGIDYPYEYVRWTERRNMATVLQLMARGQLVTAPLATHRFPIASALDAYALIDKQAEPYMAVMIEYERDKEHSPIVELRPDRKQRKLDTVGVSFVGAGNYASTILIPGLKKASEVSLQGVVTATGASAHAKAAQFGFGFAATELDAALEDEHTTMVFIATRHSTHAEFCCRSLEAGRHVFVEKPLCISPAELARIREVHANANRERPTALMVGLNRRFAPMVGHAMTRFADVPVHMMYRVNSGPIPPTHWVYDEREGGGMLIGEMCHFVDVMRAIAGTPIEAVTARALKTGNDQIRNSDNITLVLEFENGSVGTLSYNTVGNKSFTKERLETYGGGHVCVIDDYRRMETVSGSKKKIVKGRQDKGQSSMLRETIASVRTQGTAPIPFDELIEVMGAIFAARASLATGRPERPADYFEPRPA